jgi:hypothetical protein
MLASIPDPRSQTVDGAVPCRRNGVGFGQHFAGLLVVEGELVLREDFIESPPEDVENVTVKVVFRPHLGREVSNSLPEARVI